MTAKEMQEAILKWKKEQDCCILAHCYQTHDILEVATGLQMLIFVHGFQRILNASPFCFSAYCL